MNDTAGQTIYLRDYRPPAYLVESVHLTFKLSATATRVISRIAFRPNPATTDREFFLHGEDLRLIWASIDGAPVSVETDASGLRCDVPDRSFIFEAEVEIDPAGNTALEGLYLSDGIFCTQCEAEGFRKITYYPDRPDVMAVFTVRIEGDCPVLLSNGNPTGSGAGWAEWHDPWPKPAYLFALVGGDLVARSDRFTTRSGREVALNLWVRPGRDEGKTAFGIEALKKAMRWDEDVYGREYDLDVFNIVAVDAFNAGAMENKGLNIFNASAVLASPETATDADFERIEAIIAHEYFHNWTGNRITCRDWFQLCLKEGLTVYRDQQFTGDMRGHAVKRISDALEMRSYQFREDAGPLAHPVRPESFVEIDNFYTSTVYEKGAEVIGMLRRLVGDAAYAKALDLYFERHDGQAATIEDWLAVFEDSTGHDLSQFALWYSQAGTPQLHVSEHFADGTYTLRLRQEVPATPGQPDKRPMVIPVAMGLLARDGTELQPTTVLILKERTQDFTFDGLAEKPVLSVLRDFSAPVVLHHDQSEADRAILLAHDTDPFKRWDTAQDMGRELLMRMVTEGAAPDTAYLDGLQATLRDRTLDPAFRALVLQSPSHEDIAQAMSAAGHIPDPALIHDALETLRLAIAQHLQDLLPVIYAETTVGGPFAPDAEQGGKRSLGNAVLALLSRIDGGRMAARQFASADNMTLQLGALRAALIVGKGGTELDAFAAQWHEDRQVMDKWFSLQVALAAPEAAAATAERLTRHPAFDLANPNRFRAVFGGLRANSAGFHHISGAGYALMADWLIRLDALNPQVAARSATSFDTWRRYDDRRQEMMRNALQRLTQAPDLSRNTAEVVSRLLDG